MYHLYVKEHNITGLKYLGQTKRNPETYLGSGTYWKRHLKEHGDDVTTLVLGTFDNKADLEFFGRYYSKLLNVSSSKEWANLKEEAGDGGAYYPTVEQRQKIAIAHTGKKGHPKTIKLSRERMLNNNPMKEPEAAKKISEAKKEWHRQRREQGIQWLPNPNWKSA